MNIGKVIRWCRQQRGASQGEVALAAECSVSYLSMLENNKRDPTLSTITKIAHALQVPVGVLFVMAADRSDLGKIDRRLTDELQRAAAASMPGAPDKELARV